MGTFSLDTADFLFYRYIHLQLEISHGGSGGDGRDKEADKFNPTSRQLVA